MDDESQSSRDLGDPRQALSSSGRSYSASVAVVDRGTDCFIDDAFLRESPGRNRMMVRHLQYLSYTVYVRTSHLAPQHHKCYLTHMAFFSARRTACVSWTPFHPALRHDETNTNIYLQRCTVMQKWMNQLASAALVARRNSASSPMTAYMRPNQILHALQPREGNLPAAQVARGNTKIFDIDTHIHMCGRGKEKGSRERCGRSPLHSRNARSRTTRIAVCRMRA